MLRFGHPVFWFSFLAIPLLWVLGWLAQRARSRTLRTFGEHDLVHRLTDSVNDRARKLKRVFVFCGFFFLSIGLIAPKIGTSLTEVKRQGINLILMLDTSLSMKAEDVKPTRLDRAKYECSQLINTLRGDRVGLVAFAGVSYLQSPLTLDYSAAKMFLDVIDTDLIPSQGTAIGDAIETGLKAFNSDEKKHKAIVIFSDGEDHLGKATEAAREAADEGVVIYTVGVGTVSGAPIPLNSSGKQTFKRDRQGRVVTTKLDPEILQEIAMMTGGKYYQLGEGGYSSKKLYSDIFQLDRTELASHQYSRYEERYQYFLALALFFFIAEIFITDKRKSGDQSTRGRRRDQ